VRSFAYIRPASIPLAIQAAASPSSALNREPSTAAPAQFLAGGTTMLDLMKLDVMRPQSLIDLSALADDHLRAISVGPEGLRLGALVSMAEAADHPEICRDYPVIAESLRLAASQQLRNMASLGGNLLQRTRCNYFRDTSWAACNKRTPGSGCAAMDGVNRQHAVLGGSGQCIATYPGDFAQALMALEAIVHTSGPSGARAIPIGDLHRQPGDRPDVETVLSPGELIVRIDVPAKAWARRSLYLKIRDRESYEFALASAAVALDMDGDKVRQARIALGGVATVPWRARDAEQTLTGSRLDEQAAQAAAQAAFATARGREHNRFKIELGKRTLTRALLSAAAMEI
jgi:xanthine dehydrogenase YagS FAD-binding subunit